jgi:hypothetical protein
VKVLVLAPTGAAAFEVSGTTIHYGLSVPTNQSLHEHMYMDSSKRNEMRSAFFADLKCVIIHEISLVGKSFFAFIDQRLREIARKNEFVGGLHVLFVGDCFNRSLSRMGMCLKTWSAATIS